MLKHLRLSCLKDNMIGFKIFEVHAFCVILKIPPNNFLCWTLATTNHFPLVPQRRTAPHRYAGSVTLPTGRVTYARLWSTWFQEGFCHQPQSFQFLDSRLKMRDIVICTSDWASHHWDSIIAGTLWGLSPLGFFWSSFCFSTWLPPLRLLPNSVDS